MNPGFTVVSTALLFPWLAVGLSVYRRSIRVRDCAIGTRRTIMHYAPAHIGLLWCWVVLTLRIVVGMRWHIWNSVTDFCEWESVANGAMLVWLIVSAASLRLSFIGVRG